MSRDLNLFISSGSLRTKPIQPHAPNFGTNHTRFCIIGGWLKCSLAENETAWDASPISTHEL
jgi:hypothetical protein